MSFTREEAHRFVDSLFDSFPADAEIVPGERHVTGEDPLSDAFDASGDRPETEEPADEEPARELPEGKRAVRTRSQGDRVYILDEEKKTRRWATTPDILAEQGFILTDVVEIEEDDLLKYQMEPAIYTIRKR